MPDVLIDRARILARIAELSTEIRRDVPGDVHFVAVLKGAFVFLADLMRAIEGPVSCDFMVVTSYGAVQQSSGDIVIRKDLEESLQDREVVIVEDIVDSGRTLARLQQILRSRQPRSLRTVCLLDKRSRREVAVAIDYVGFVIPDRFVVGYGLDLDGRYRNLPDISILDE